MTEQEWLNGHDPKEMLAFVSASASERKLRLFCLACCARIFPQLTDERSRDAACILAAYLDGKATSQELHEAWTMASAAAVGEGSMAISAHQSSWSSIPGQPEPNPELAPARLVADATAVSAQHAATACASASFPGWQRYCVRVLQDVFGNPFRPVTTLENAPENCRATAQRIYDEGSWQDLPILGDALEESGTLCEGILDHCRSRQKHFRGCWVVDLLLSRL